MKYLVAGGTSGIGKAVTHRLRNLGHIVVTLSKDHEADICIDLNGPWNPLAHPFHSFDGLVNCAGVNLLKAHDDLTMNDMLKLFRVNALSTFFLVRMFRPSMTCAVVSDAAWTPMTHSLAYNVSKAAQHMLIRQMAHEDRENIIFGVAPGKVAGTGMSAYIDNTFPPMRGMTYEEGREYQLKGLRTGEMTANEVAKFICNLVVNPHKYYHGHIFPIGG